MERKRLPNEHSDDELLELVHGLEDEEVQHQEVDSVFKDVRSFVLAINLKPGKNLVPSKLLYKVYKNWSKEPVTKRMFLEVINTLFKTSSNSLYVWLNENSIDISFKLHQKLRLKRKFALASPGHRQHIVKFFNEKEILDGDMWIPAYVLYHMYDKWCYDNNKRVRFSEYNFKLICRSFFKHNRNTEDEGIYFKLSKSILNHVTEDTITNLKEARRKRHGRKKEKIT